MQKSKPIIVNCMKMLNPTSVLDIGCGQCKFSNLFIKKGITVVGIDKEKTVESKDNFTFIQGDIRDFEFKEKYDLIVATGILHFLEKEEVYGLIEKIKTNTMIGGFNFLVCMSNLEPYNDNKHFYPEKEELNKFYSGWKIVENELCLSKKHGEESHQHKVIIFLAQKI